MKEKLVGFMQGRYGTDKLNTFILVLAILCSFLGSFTRVDLLYLVNYGLIGYVIFRILSRNCYKRSQENQKFLKRYNKYKWWFQKQKRRMEEGKKYRFFSCPKCKQIVRVPKRKGKIAITCPKCRVEFKKRT